MDHSFATWSSQLPAKFRSEFDHALGTIERAFEQAASPDPKDLRDTYAIKGIFAPDQKHRLCLVALACAKACPADHPRDFQALVATIKVAMKGELPFCLEELEQFLEFFAAQADLEAGQWPVAEVVGQLERLAPGQPVPPAIGALLKRIGKRVDESTPKKSKTLTKLLERIHALSDNSVSRRLKPDEGWADSLARELGDLSKGAREQWERLLGCAAAVRPAAPAASWDVPYDEIEADLMTDEEAHFEEYYRRMLARRPAADWQREMTACIKQVGADEFRARRLEWFRIVPESRPGTLSQFSMNREVLRGLVWSCLESDDDELVRVLRIAAGFFFRKNSPLGKAAVVVLATSTSPQSLTELTHLQHQLKAGSQRDLVGAAAKHLAVRQGISPDELPELPYPDSGFTDFGERVQVLSGFRACLAIEPAGRVELRWFKPTGDPQKSVPAKVKREHASELRDLKAAVKEVKATLATARTRFEAAALEGRSWSLEQWRAQCVDHPVVGTVARRLIWQFEKEKGRPATGLMRDRVESHAGRRVNLDNVVRVRVWHPLGSSVDEVLKWRRRLEKLEITQPFKQAHREVYVLTDAERKTRTYSNRFAGHILKQSQFRAVAKTRGWESDYLGAWDLGAEGGATRSLPNPKLTVNWLIDAAGGQSSDSPGFLYIATDRVQFVTAENDPVELADLPPIVFSEIMRDIDLFVAVSSVGNDPTWSDGGPEGRFTEYWSDYSFGQLAESALSRKAALEQIVPKLKIRDRCTFADRFLVVQGDIRTYRIHLGSANILMEPNDQYLCIVPDKLRAIAETPFLPFEGDTRLAVILSKALLLADDSRIADRSIRSQIGGGPI